MDRRREAHARRPPRIQIRGGSCPMKLTEAELEFLSAWAREEWESACYHLPAHRLQLAHGVPGASLIVFIKAWTRAEGKKDRDILCATTNAEPNWPWANAEEFSSRLAEASLQCADREIGRRWFDQCC